MRHRVKATLCERVVFEPRHGTHGRRPVHATRQSDAAVPTAVGATAVADARDVSVDVAAALVQVAAVVEADGADPACDGLADDRQVVRARHELREERRVVVVDVEEPQVGLAARVGGAHGALHGGVAQVPPLPEAAQGLRQRHDAEVVAHGVGVEQVGDGAGAGLVRLDEDEAGVGGGLGERAEVDGAAHGRGQRPLTTGVRSVRFIGKRLSLQQTCSAVDSGRQGAPHPPTHVAKPSRQPDESTTRHAGEIEKERELWGEAVSLDIRPGSLGTSSRATSCCNTLSFW